jgi:phenylacetate-CoA oxygenase PaaI subunit
MTTSTSIDNAALFALLSSLADNKQAIGRQYAHWCNGAPALEAAVAAAAMAQDELGHARTLYPLLADFTQSQEQPEQIEPTTRTLHYQLAVLDNKLPSWTDFVATNFLLDTALTTFFEAAQASSYEPLRQRANKVVQEECIHFIHGQGWVRRLARAGGAVRSTLLASLLRIGYETLCWFGPDDDAYMLQLYQEKIIDAPPAELRNRYLQKVMPILQELEIAPPITFNTATQQWEIPEGFPRASWDAVARRLR